MELAIEPRGPLNTISLQPLLIYLTFACRKCFGYFETFCRLLWRNLKILPAFSNNSANYALAKNYFLHCFSALGLVQIRALMCTKIWDKLWPKSFLYIHYRVWPQLQLISVLKQVIQKVFCWLAEKGWMRNRSLRGKLLTASVQVIW